MTTLLDVSEANERGGRLLLLFVFAFVFGFGGLGFLGGLPFLFFSGAAVQGQFFGGVDFVLLQFFEKTFIAEIERMRVLPVMVGDFAKALDNFGIVNFDGEFAARIKTARRKIDGADDGAGMVGEKHFAVKLEVLDLVNLDADIIHDAKATDTFGEFFLF